MLSACATPEVIIQTNEFRNETECSLKNNNFRGDNYENITFYLSKSIPNNLSGAQKKKFLEQKLVAASLSIHTSHGAGIKPDSHIHFMTDNKIIETTALSVDRNTNNTWVTNPGYFIRGVYYPGTSYMVYNTYESMALTLSTDDIRSIAKSNAVKLKIETFSGAVTATLEKETLEAIKTFATRCLDSDFTKTAKKE